MSDIPKYLLCDNQQDFAEKMIVDNMGFVDTSYFIAGNVHR